jgi:hypothetical protein
MSWCCFPSATTASSSRMRSRDISNYDNNGNNNNNKTRHQRQSTMNNDQMWLLAVAIFCFAIGMLYGPPPPPPSLSTTTPFHHHHHHPDYDSTLNNGRTNAAAFASPTTTTTPSSRHHGTKGLNDSHETRDASETFRGLLQQPQLWISSPAAACGRDRATQIDASASAMLLENDIRQHFLESCVSGDRVTPQPSCNDRRWLLVPLSNHHGRVEINFSFSNNNNNNVPRQSHPEMIEILHHLAYAMKVALATERELVLVVMDDCSEDGLLWWSRETCAVTSNRTTSGFLGCHPWKDQFPILSCPINVNGSTRSRSSTAATATSIPGSAARQGILHPSVSTASGSDFFNVEFYGPQPVALLDSTTVARSKKSWLLDTVPKWDRYYGQNWVQSNVMTFLWDQLVVPAVVGHSPGAASDLAATTTTKANTVTDTTGNALFPSHPYIAIVIDDSIQTRLQHTYGRNFTRTHDWTRLLDIANHIRTLTLSASTTNSSGHSSKDDPASHPDHRYEDDNTIPREGLNKETRMGIVPNTIYLVLAVGMEPHQSHWSPPWMTKNSSSIRPKTISHHGIKWVIHLVSIPAKSAATLQNLDQQQEQQHSWNVSNYIVLLEQILRRADYLIGSFQSPLFLVATELNTGTMPKTTTTSARRLVARRHWSVDLEWYPYP